MNQIPSVKARRAIEALRAGVPNRDAVAVLRSQQPEIEREIKDRLQLLKRSERAKGLLISGDFGTGKSHMIEYLTDAALRDKFVCSRVVISKETPFYDMERVVRSAIRSAIVPGKELCDPVIELIESLKPSSDGYQDLCRALSDRRHGFDPLFAAMMLLMRERGGEERLFGELVQIWSGERPRITDLKSKLKECGHRDTFQLRGVRASDLAPQRLEFMSALIAANGFTGWIIFFDELELIGRYSALQRGRSYAALAQWMDAPCSTNLGRVFTVGAITSNFESQVLDSFGKDDRSRMPDRLENAASPRYRSMVDQAKRGMHIISKNAISIEKPDTTILKNTYEAVRRIYGEAYDCQPNSGSFAKAAVDVRMRSEIKRWITEWDLRRIDPSYKPEIESEQLIVDYREAPDLEKTSDEVG